MTDIYKIKEAMVIVEQIKVCEEKGVIIPLGASKRTVPALELLLSTAQAYVELLEKINKEKKE